MNHYDVIVIGTGGVGSAALYHSAKRGARVLGLDRFPPGHNQGSSHGQTRVIRIAYHEHPDYVPLLLRAYELWDELEQAVDKKLFYQVGLLFGGPADGPVISGVLRAAAEHKLDVDRLSLDDARHRFPAYRLREDFQHIFERRAGYLLVEECVKANIACAQRAGADLKTGVTVLGWKPVGTAVEVQTDQGNFTADRLIITAGAWASDLLASLGIPLYVLRKPLFWYRTDEPKYNLDAGCPCFFFETLGGEFYGFPKADELGVKMAEHTNGTVVDNPLTVDRSLHREDQQRIEQCIDAHLPGITHECTSHAVCMYTMSPDQHFILGSHPTTPQVVFAAGLSGHGFKFTSVLGEVMSQLALDGQSKLKIEFLSPQRFKK